MIEIAGGIVLAVLVLAFIRWVYNLVFVQVPASKPYRDKVIDERRQKHQEWEKRHPIAKHIYKFDENKNR